MIRFVVTAVFLSLMVSAGAAAERPKLQKSTLDTVQVATKNIAQARIQSIIPKIRRG